MTLTSHLTSSIEIFVSGASTPFQVNADVRIHDSDLHLPTLLLMGRS